MVHPEFYFFIHVSDELVIDMINAQSGEVLVKEKRDANARYTYCKFFSAYFV
jgi:hypothetical protein